MVLAFAGMVLFCGGTELGARAGVRELNLRIAYNWAPRLNTTNQLTAMSRSDLIDHVLRSFGAFRLFAASCCRRFYKDL